jgi:hypothetical protein
MSLPELKSESPQSARTHTRSAQRLLSRVLVLLALLCWFGFPALGSLFIRGDPESEAHLIAQNLIGAVWFLVFVPLGALLMVLAWWIRRRSRVPEEGGPPAVPFTVGVLPPPPAPQAVRARRPPSAILLAVVGLVSAFGGGPSPSRDGSTVGTRSCSRFSLRYRALSPSSCPSGPCAPNHACRELRRVR